MKSILYMHTTYRFFLVVWLLSVVSDSLSQDADQLPSTDEMKKLSMEELMNIEVMSVSKWSEKISTAPSAIQVITREDIRRSGATSIPEALRLAYNLHVCQKTAHDWTISARGFNTDLANKLLVLIDGRTVYTPLFSGVFWDRQDYLLEDIERIEVISGPGGTLWGSNAVNGIINIITRDAKDTQGLYLEAGVGTQLRNFAGARYGSRIGEKIFVRAYAKYFDRDEAVFPNGDDAMDAWYMGQGGFRMDANGSDKDAFTLQGDYYNGEEDISAGGKSKVSGGNILGRWTHVFSDDADIRLQIYYDRTNLNNWVPESISNGTELAPAGTLKDELDTYDLDFQHRMRLGKRNKVVWGLGYRYMHDEVQNAPALAFYPENLSRTLFNVYVQDEIMMTENLFFTAGTKVEHNDYTGFEYEPSIRFQWHMGANQTLWSAVSRAVRIPSRIDRHVRLPTPAFSPIVDNLLVGGENFKSETVIAYELGFRTTLGKKVSGSISTFYNDYDHIRSTSSSPPPAVFGLPLFYENNLHGETYGVELTLAWQVLDRMRVYTGYNLFHQDIRVKRGKTDFNMALNENADPKHRVSLRTLVTILPQLDLSVALRWVDSFQFNNGGEAGRVPDYTEMDACLTWQVAKKFEISVVGQNLLHDHHMEYVISSPNPREEIERNLYAKIAFRL